MTETPDQIRQEVEQAHHRVAQDLNALEFRVRRITDWRWHFRQHPWPILGAAFGAALVVALAIGPHK